jgi:drug/metabolite transporter (DMT)-like permease
MPTTYLVLFVITAVASAQWMRFGQGRGCNVAWLGVWIYSIAAACTAAWVAAHGQKITPVAVGYGLAGGIALGATYHCFFLTVKHFGVGIGHLTRQMALVAPVMASILIWHETLTPAKGVGLALVFVALPLMSRPLKHEHAASRRVLLLLPPGLVLFGGITGILFKAYTVEGTSGATEVYVLFLCLGAGAVSFAHAAGARIRLQRKEAFFGITLGLDSAFLNYFRIRLLETEEGLSAFPSMSLGIIVLSIFFAMVIWKERFRGRVLLGVVLAIVALVLIRFQFG